MSYFYLIYIITLLILTKYNLRIKFFLVSIISYVLFMDNVYFNVEFYILTGTALSLVFIYCFYDKSKPVQSCVEISTTLLFKVIELVLIIFPTTYISYLHNFYFYLDDMFIVSLLFILFSREVGYHPFNMDKENLRKYILVTTISYLTVIFIF